MPAIPSLDETHLQAVCDVLGDTGLGLTGSEIGKHLHACNIPDPFPSQTKRHRLFEALVKKQRQDECANNIFAFIKRVLSPALYHQNPIRHAELVVLVNKPLSFSGYQISEAGEIIPVKATRTLSQAEERAGRLQAALQRRNVHADILKFCKAELIQQNYFHAVLEATKSVSQKIRDKTGLPGDGGELANRAFALGQTGIPFLAFNSLQTDTEKSEQSGLMNIFIGVFGAFRNVTAHGPKISWNMTEQDALDLLTTISLLHRRLDAAIRTGKPV